MYNEITPPFKKKLRLMNRGELQDYYLWVINNKQDRLCHLYRVIAETPGFADWVPTYTPESLLALGNWLSHQIQLEEREIAPATPSPFLFFPAGSTTDTLNRRSLSIAFDCALYLTEVLLANSRSLKITQITNDPNNINYGHIVIDGFKKDQKPIPPLNPFTILKVAMLQIATRKKDTTVLKEVYEYWNAFAS